MKKVNLELDGNLFQPHDKEIWVYALDSHCIGVSARNLPSWKKYALFSAHIPYKRIGNKIEITLPQSLFYFYCFVQKDVEIIDSYTQNADIVLLTLRRKVK